jgi:hypothetical protein
MTMALRADTTSGYVELSIASLVVLIPAAVLATWAAVLGLWAMSAIQVLKAVGLVLTARGLWRDDGRLFDSIDSRVGLGLIIASSAGGMALVQLTDLGPRPDQQVNPAIGHMAILGGLVLIAVANHTGRFHRRVQLAGLSVLGPGSAFSVGVAVVNAATQTGWWRLAMLIYLVPSSVAVWACLSVASRPNVFDEAI